MRKYGLKALALATAMSMVLSSPLQVFAKRRANTAGSWKQSGENWSFLDEKGQNVLGWIYGNGSWYYVDPKTGTLRSGWLYLADGSQYFFSNKHDGSFGKMLTGWNWIDGNCYYFVTEADEREGKLIKDGRCERQHSEPHGRGLYHQERRQGRLRQRKIGRNVFFREARQFGRRRKPWR